MYLKYIRKNKKITNKGREMQKKTKNQKKTVENQHRIHKEKTKKKHTKLPKTSPQETIFGQLIQQPANARRLFREERQGYFSPI